MKYIIPLFLLSACARVDINLQTHLQAERDFHSYKGNIESAYNLDNYDPEYVDDCFYYQDLVCYFE
jgi:hypothetical protein